MQGIDRREEKPLALFDLGSDQSAYFVLTFDIRFVIIQNVYGKYMNQYVLLLLLFVISFCIDILMHNILS